MNTQGWKTASVLQCVVVCCVAVCCSVLQCAAVCCSVLQCVAVCRSVLQCVFEFVSPVEYTGTEDCERVLAWMQAEGVRVMSHTCMSHVTHMHDSCHIYKISHVTYTDESGRTYE